MTYDPQNQPQTASEAGQKAQEAPSKQLSPAAQRALAEAEERRKAAEAARRQAPTELNGRGGLDPARYGDWEVKGIISDF
jgi:hypothetical protein